MASGVVRGTRYHETSRFMTAIEASHGLEEKPDRSEEIREIVLLFRLLMPQWITKG
jgi:hypothetical protein